jgi:uncharacterized membrane protein YkoI
MTRRSSQLRIAISSLAFLIGTAAVLPAASAAVDRERAASLAQGKAPGRVLAVERGVHVDGSVIWRVQVLTSAGEVRLIVIDAETGRIR